jgi:LPXTG-motif cell wall-anchored protein
VYAEPEVGEVPVTQPAAETPAKTDDKAAALAETGVDAATPIFVFGALGAALLGAALLIGARLRRRSSEV